MSSSINHNSRFPLNMETIKTNSIERYIKRYKIEYKKVQNVTINQINEIIEINKTIR